MKKKFQVVPFEVWETPIKLGVSRPFLCIQGGAEGADILLDAIDELLTDGPPAKRTMTSNFNRHKKGCSIIRLILSPENDELRQMSITRSRDVAVLEFTLRGLSQLRKAVLLWQSGAEDFTISPEGNRKSAKRKPEELGTKDLESGELWFWTPNTDP